ncbi:putative polysaccharide biosynthesis protein [Lachnoclostridium sp. Marseille-P6806]|uniref:putative polysaccharide biosynthesis protein n=1 Tax=Lachnoclostridium sp. Marseille-P6806 TaxID=2364793 RepID=UPI0010321EF2|nr:polysaccharide biosynthesis protein [Lachnoclostridium sp. Marseille-P6806]
MAKRINRDSLRLRDHNGSGQLALQAGILAAASIAVRMIGLLYQSPLTAIIGDEGNGYYSLAYNIYTIILLISSYSIPSAISKIMAQKLALGEYRNVQRIFRVSLAYVCVIGTACGLFMYFGASLLVGAGSVPVLRVFAPTIFLFGILGVFRGYFQAHSSMLQTSISQIIEQIMNAGMSILAAWLLMQRVRGADHTTQAVYGAAGSALGTGCGVLAGLLFMLWVYYLSRRRIRRRCENDSTGREDAYGTILRTVMAVVTPFVLSSFILNLTTSLNQTIYTRIFTSARGLDEAAVTMAYGIFSRKATVITNIPISIATATSAAVIPSISSSFAGGDRRETLRRCRSAVRLTAFVALPSVVGLMVLAEPITMLLFPQRASLEQASWLLAALAVTVFFYSISTVTTAILQSTEHMRLPLVSAVLALVIQTAVLIVLLLFTRADVYALVIASVVYSVLIFAANEFFIRKYLGRHAFPSYRSYGRTLISALIMGAGAFSSYRLLCFVLGLLGMEETRYLTNLLALLPALVIAVFLYGFMLVRTGAIKEADLLSMPKGSSLIRLMKRLRWI